MSPGIERRIGRPVRMHSGIETGMVVTSPTAFLGAEAGLLGDTVNVAARLEDLSSTGEVLVGPNTYQLVANVVDVEGARPGRAEGKGSTGVCPASGPRADVDGAAGFAPEPVRR